MNPYKKNKLFFLMLIALCGVSCSKDEQQLSDYDNNKINIVIADNFNMSMFSAALKVSGLDKQMQQSTDNYTALVPSDAAFTNAGYANAVSILSANPTTVSRIANYHTLDGKHDLSKLPLAFNQELRSHGGKLYVTNLIRGTDTILTINGARVVSKNIPASNGLIQVLDRVLTPYLHDFLGDAVAAEENTTFFTQALKTSGLLETINGAGPYTVFAPNNAAMQAIGYSTINQVSTTDPEVLKRLVNDHIISGRKFVQDYLLLTTANQTTYAETMLSGQSVTITLRGNVSSFTGITLRGTGNTAQLNLVTRKQDILAGNGVLHIIDGVLQTTGNR